MNTIKEQKTFELFLSELQKKDYEVFCFIGISKDGKALVMSPSYEITRSAEVAKKVAPHLPDALIVEGVYELLKERILIFLNDEYSQKKTTVQSVNFLKNDLDKNQN